MATDFLEAFMLYYYLYLTHDPEVADKMKVYYYLSFFGMLSLLPLIFHHNLKGWIPGYLA